MRSLVSTLERSWRSQIFGLAISFEELLETIGEIYCQGRRTAKTQAVCLELGPLCSILEFPSPPSLSPDPPVQAYLTFSLALEVERPTSKAREKRPPGYEVGHFLWNCSLFWLEMCRKPIFCPNIAQKCKTCSRLPEQRKILLSTPEVF